MFEKMQDTRATNLVIIKYTTMHALNLVKYLHRFWNETLCCRLGNQCNVGVIVVTGHACWNDVHVVYYSHKLKTQSGSSNNIH